MTCIEPSLSIGVGGPIPAAIRHIVQDLKKVCRGMEGGVFLLGLEEVGRVLVGSRYHSSVGRKLE